MNQLKKTLPPLPHYMQDLPLNEKGYPIPFFASYFDGKPDFRVIDTAAISKCVMNKVCWCCGKPLTDRATFVAGPLLAVNRMSAEPPSHPECAEFAAKACPFLLYPKSKRREANMPEGVTDRYSTGEMLVDNPGVTVLWTTKGYSTVVDRGRVAFQAGDPVNVQWFSEGKPASREVAAAALGQRICELRASLHPSDVTPNLIVTIKEMSHFAISTLPEE